MPTRNINLTDHFDRFVETQITSGRSKNASEVLRAGLRLLELQEEQEQQKLAVLRSLAAEGFAALDQGQAGELEGDDDLAAFIAGVGSRAAARASRRGTDC